MNEGINVLPAVTHVLIFQNARKVTSRRCVPGRVDSPPKKHVYYLRFAHSIAACVAEEPLSLLNYFKIVLCFLASNYLSTIYHFDAVWEHSK